MKISPATKHPLLQGEGRGEDGLIADSVRPIPTSILPSARPDSSAMKERRHKQHSLIPVRNVVCFWLLIMFITGQTATAFPFADTGEAIDAYNKGNYEDSLARFRQIQVEAPEDPGARFNLASAQYQTGNLSEAARGFEEVLSRSKSTTLKEKARYNLGNTSFRQGNLQASADYYRKALDLKPSDVDAKQNLEFVLKELDKQQERKKDEKDKKGNENKENQQQASKQKQQESKSSHKDKQQEKGPSSQSSQDKEQQNESGELKDAGSQGEAKQGNQREAGAKPDPKALAPEEAARLLNTLSDDQRAFIREQAKRIAPNARSRAEDW